MIKISYNKALYLNKKYNYDFSTSLGFKIQIKTPILKLFKCIVSDTSKHNIKIKCCKHYLKIYYIIEDYWVANYDNYDEDIKSSDFVHFNPPFNKLLHINVKLKEYISDYEQYQKVYKLIYI